MAVRHILIPRRLNARRNYYNSLRCNMRCALNGQCGKEIRQYLQFSIKWAGRGYRGAMESLYRPLFCSKIILGNEATNAVSGTHNSRPVEEQSTDYLAVEIR
jgi:hypothetical protein